MVLTFSTSHFALAYVDELLFSFSSNSPKYVQLIFQRLLTIAGRESKVVSQHIAQVLLKSIGFGYGDGSSSVVKESDAESIIQEIMVCAIEGKERDPFQAEGAQRILSIISESVSEHLSVQHASGNPMNRYQEPRTVSASDNMPVCQNNCYQHIVMHEAHIKAAFASMLTVEGDLEPFVNNLIEEGLADMINEHQTNGTKFNIRIEFLQMVTQAYLDTNMPSVCSLGFCKLINSVIQDESGRESTKIAAPLQPMLFNILAKNKDVKANLSLEKLMQQAHDIVSRRLTSLDEVEEKLEENNRYLLKNVFLYSNNDELRDLSRCLEFFKKNVPPTCINSDSLALALSCLFSSKKRVEIRVRNHTIKRVILCPSALAGALTEYASMDDDKWLEVFQKLDSPFLRFSSSSKFRFFISFFEKAFSDGFPLRLMFKKWNFPSGQIAFFERLVRQKSGNVLSLYDYETLDVSPLEHHYADNNPLYISVRCLDLFSVLLEIEKEHKEERPRLDSIFNLMMKDYPDLVALALLDPSLEYTDYTFAIVSRAIEYMLPNHINLKSFLKYARTHESIPPDFFNSMFAFICKKLNQAGVMISDAPRLQYTVDSLQAFREDIDFANVLMAQKDLNNTFELVVVCHNLGICDFQQFLQRRLIQDEKQLLVFLIADAKYRKYTASSIYFPQIINRFLLENKRLLIKHGLVAPSLSKKIIDLDVIRLGTGKDPEKPKSIETPVSSPYEDCGRLQRNEEASPRTPAIDALPSSSTGSYSCADGISKDVTSSEKQFMNETERSSSVRSINRTPSGSSTQATSADRMQRQFGNNSQPPFNPLNNYMQQVPSQNPPNIGVSNMFNGNSFGGSQELIRPPGSHSFGSNSPTNQPRPGMPPAPQRQNSNSSWNIPGQPRSTGPPTPLQLDFRAQGPPTQQEFQPRASNPQPLIFEGDLSQMQFSDDVQDEANSFFEAIYTHRSHLMTVPTLIDKLKGFKNSSEQREHKLLACVVKNLFEEYKFFNDYPDRELKITAELYGGIIREGIINESANLHFATAVRKVIESLSQPPNSNLFTFGLVALEHCRKKLCTYPKVCSMITSLDNFNKFPQNIKDYVVAGMTGDLPRVADLGRSTPPVWQAPRTADSRNSATGSAVPQNRTGNNVLSYTNVDTLVKATENEGAEVAQPSEAIVDKMSFLFNNLSQTNMGAKKEEVLTLIADHGEPFIKWLAQYVVMKRVSIEQNFQPLYNTFIQVLDHPLLDHHIKKETFRNIRILLRSDKRQAASNYSDRQLLKNLGMWLGAITIARSKPILINELDLKSLLLEAYYKGQQELLFVVPFIAKILLSCSKTPIFSASCSWIRSILKVLAELHNEPDLKINLKFEIEVLCKELVVDLTALPIEGILKDTDKLVRVQQQLSEIKMLAPPNQFPSSSPVPRQGSDILPAPGNDTKPSTPLPDNENGNGQEAAVQSHFAYHDINVISYEGLTPHLQIKSNLPLFQLHPLLKQVVRPSLTLAIKELIGPVAERAQKIAMTVTENLIRKDFAMDPNEKNLKSASFHMMRAMTAGMAMITCRDPLAVTMASSLQNAFTNALRNSVNSPDSAKMIEEAAQVITQENVELATNFIVKTACEKAASEMEKRLEPEFQKRITARQAGKSYIDESAQAIQTLLPEQVALHTGETPKELLDIYMQFSTRICGFKPSVNEDMSPDSGRPLVLTDERTGDHLSSQLNMIIKEVDNTMSAQPNVGNKAYNAVGIIRDLLHQLAMNPREAAPLENVIGKSVEHFLHAFHVDPNTKNPLDVEWPRRLRDLFIGVTRLCLNLTSITEIARKVTATIIMLNVDYKWNVEAVEVLYKHSLIQTTLFDQHLAAKMCSGPAVDQATFFSQRLYRSLSSGDNKAQFQAIFPNTYEQLVKISQMMPGRVPVPGEPASINSPLLETEGVNEHDLSSKVVENVLREWITMCYTPSAQRNPQEALSQMIHVMHDHGCLSTDEKVSSFFKMCTEMCVEVTNKMLRNDNNQSAHHSTIIRQRCYYTLDAYVKLIALMIKYSDGNQTQTKITLLKKILSLITNVLVCDHEMRGKDFNSLPYHRILITLFNELTTPDGTALDQLQWSVLESFGQALFMLQPRRASGFAYAWLDIVGHRNVIGKLLGGSSDSSESIKMAAMYTQLIICHLKFMAPFLRNIQLPKSVALLYKGTLRVLLVILHDFPELLCEFHYVICDTIPANCVQLRNLVLSAYPRNMRLPDPFALNFKQVDAIPDMAQEPKSNLNMSTIIPDPIRIALDDYLTNRTNVDFLTALPGLLQTSQAPGQKYNTTVLNAVVLYVGIKAIECLHQKRMLINIHSIAHTSYMDVFQNLAVQLCTEGRYLLFNAIANQLRYPNAHTHYFSCVFLFLFLNSDYDAIQEQITRILFERLVALRPHPWGLLITFIELIKNPVYNFWKFEFTRCAPEIERLFQNVANTCVSSSRPPNESTSRP